MNTPTNIQELEEYIHEYASNIYVREKIDGKWGSYSLAELPIELSKQHLKRFVDKGIIPVRLKSQEEIDND